MSREREAYLNLLLALALGMVVTTDVLGRSWLPLGSPAAGVLFAASAARVAAACDRAGSLRAFYRTELMRLLAPFWLIAAVLVPVLLASGWHTDENLGSAQLTVGTGWRWLLPLADPPVSTDGLGAATGVWFIRALLWFLLLTPPLLWTFRRWPVRLIVVPVLALLLITVGLVNVEGVMSDIASGFCVYTVCWLLGFAYLDGSLERLPVLATTAAGAATIGAGLWCAVALRAQYATGIVTDIPLAGALVSTGAVLVLLRLAPALGWLARLRRTAAVLRTVSRQTITVVLWAGLASAVAPAVLDYMVRLRIHIPEARVPLAELATSWVLVLLAVLLLGWVEAVPATPGPHFLLLRRRLRVLRPPSAAAGRTFVLEDNVVRDDVPGDLPRSDMVP
jgi:hypothetical protein